MARGYDVFRQMYVSAAFMLASRGLHHMEYHLIHDGNDHEIGHCGIAWAAQRWLLDKHGLYDKMIIGGGDNLMFQAMLGHFRDHTVEHMSAAMRHDVHAWATRSGPLTLPLTDPDRCRTVRMVF